MKKLLEQQNTTNLAISVLCDLSKNHCSMCEWEQECSDNPLLFNPVFARQYIKERQSWLINKQPMCEKCKLQIGEHYSQNIATLFKEQKINVDCKTEMPETNTLFKEQIINVHSKTETPKNKRHQIQFISSATTFQTVTKFPSLKATQMFSQTIFHFRN